MKEATGQLKDQVLQKRMLLRKERYLHGVSRNLVIHSIIDDEWPEVKRNLLIKQQSYMMITHDITTS